MILFMLMTFNKKRIRQGSLYFSIFIDLILQSQICHFTMAQTEISRSFFSPISSDDSKYIDDILDWKTYFAESSPYITDCGSSYIFGGLSIFTYQTTITKTFILPPHSKLKIEFKFWRLTSWFGSFYIFYIDGFKAHDDNPNTSTGTQICGVGTQGQVYQISQEFDHDGNSAIATLISQQMGSYWGISDFILYVQKCPKGCEFCDTIGNCLQWNRMLAFFKNILVTGGEGWARDYFPYDGTGECGSFWFYGPFLMTEKISIDLNLSDPHTKFKIQFKFLCAYVTGSITIRVIGNGGLLTNYAYPLNIITTTNIICGSYLKLDKVYIGEFMSSDPILTFTLDISAFNTVSSSTPFYGIRDFEVFTDAEKKQVQSDSDSGIICSDNNIYAFDGCFSYIYDCNEGCNNCVKGLCIQCLSPWVLNKISGQCVSKCGDQIVVSSEQCDDGNYQPYDGCYECQFSCPLNCKVCQYGKCLICDQSYQLIDNNCQFNCIEDENLSQYQDYNNEGHYCQISKFLINPYLQHAMLNTDIQVQYDSDSCKIDNYGIFAYIYDMCPFEIPQNCKIYFLNQCQICQDEYDLSNNNYCIPKCGNGIIQEYEQCDDANLEQFDGCYYCNSNCQLECVECYYSQCFQCIEGWNLINFKCFSECGDGKIALLSEQCDDQNNNSNDGCFECKFECSQNCLFCNLNFDCLQCQKYYEVQNNSCVPNCGDGLIFEGFEQCDDGNDIEFDGCYKCQFSCQQNCQICDQYQCLDPRVNQCEYGQQLIDDQCLSICGDLIIAPDEQCDDANEIPFDGCYQCQYSCSLNCMDCMDGQCLKCDNGYEIMDNLCLDICGNGIKTEKEECDDKNLITQDGCSDECKVEINWTCSQINLETSICLLMKPPHFNLLFINQTYDSFFVEMQITSQVKLQDSQSNLTQSLQLSLIDIDISHYIIYEYVLVEPNVISVQDINYLFQIKFLKQETMDIYFQVSFDTELVDQYGFSVENQQCKLHLRNPIVLSDIERTVSHKMSSLNMYMLIGLGVSSFIILLSGNPVECFEVLDTLQYQSNLKYINSNYPENVMIYFESSQVVTIIPVLEKLQFLDLFNIVIGQEQIQAYEKFLFYDVNAELISNLSGLIAQLVIVVLLLIASKIYFWIFIKKCYNKFRIFIYNNNKFYFSKQLVLIIHMLNQLSIQINQLISINGIVYIIQANSWDLIFKTVLYLYSQKEKNLRNQFQNIFACTFIICILVLLSSIFSLKRSNIKLKKRNMHLHEGLMVAKKFFFLLVLIGFQKSSLTQSVLLSLINTIYITIIILCQVVSKKIDLILILMFELPVILFTLLNIAYEQTYANFLGFKSQILIGFGQIGLLSFGILAPLIKYVYQIKIKFKRLIQKWIQQKVNKQQPASASLFL